MSARKYSTAGGMRKALEERINRSAKTEGHDIMTLRRHVAFDRLLARIFSTDNREKMVLKGGYAIELWLNNARATKDIDLSFKTAQFSSSDEKDFNDPVVLQEYLQDLIDSTTNNKDFFEFTIGNAIKDLENAPYGGYRFQIHANMAGRLFIRFEIDIAIGDYWIESHETVKTHNWLEFAGIEAPEIPVISKEQQFAEKIHAYTLPRKSENSRVKDLVDMLILIEQGKMKKDLVKQAINKTFERRKSHPIPKELITPPATWKSPFRNSVKTINRKIEIEQAFGVIEKYYNDL